MTRNQIEYWSLLENKRANRARETETKRSNLAHERETNRSNLAREAETHRANVIQEQLTALRDFRNYINTVKQLNETQRSNKASERFNSQKLEEQIRATRAAEQQAKQSLTNAQYQAQTARINAEEQIRANQQREIENKRSNMAQEAIRVQGLFETNRANLASEGLKHETNLMNFAYQQQSLQVKRAELEESKRRNLVAEQLQIAQIGTQTLTNTLNAYSRYSSGNRRLR